MNKEYILRGLDCPNCASKIEKEVGALGGVEASVINLMRQTLTVNVDSAFADEVEKKIKEIVYRHEPEVCVFEPTSERKSNNDNSDNDGINKTLLRLIIGAVIYVIGIVLGEIIKVEFPAEIACLIVAYLVLGVDVIIKAFKNIVKGRIFDENFLMTLSTVGAFIIGEYPEAVAVMMFYQIGEFFQMSAVKRSRRSIADLMNIRPDFANVVRNGELVTVDPESVSVGDVIVVKPGEKIPLDGIVVDGRSTLDTKALTGEFTPKSVSQGDEVLSGCINQSGVVNIRVTRVYGESTVAKIIDLVENASSRKAPTENFITTFARYYTPIVVFLAVILAAVPPLMFNGQWFDWIHRSFVFLVISCPCALVISIPLTFFGGIGAASKHGVLIKGSNYLEALDNIGTVVFDKTGTLTKGVFKVTNVFTEANFTPEQVLKYAAQAESYSSHPIAMSVISAYGEEILQSDITNYTEIPGYGISAVAEGKKILVGNAKLMEEERVSYTNRSETGTKIYVAVDGKFAGCILIADEIKDDSKNTVAALKQIGVEKIVMLTGDNEQVARDVSNQLGIDEYYAHLLPEHKVDKLEALDRKMRSDSKLAFVGDGINDAPVLARAVIGIAMGGLGTDAAIEAADVVLMTDEPHKLIEAIEVARATKRIVIQNIVFSLVVKNLFLILGALGIAGMWEAVFADVGVTIIAVLNAMRIMRK